MRKPINLCALAVALVAASGTAGAAPELPADHPKLAAPASPGKRLAPGTVLARVDDATITAGDLDATIASMPAPDRFEFAAPEALRDLVEGMIDRELMARAARREKLEPATADAWLARELGKVPAPAPAAIERYYREHPAEFTTPKRVRVTRAVARTAAAASRLREDLARGAKAEALRTAHAADIASLEEGLWLQDAPKKTDLLVAALALKAGETSAVLPVDTGFVVMRAEETRPAAARPLAEVSAGIAASLDAVAREKALEQARRQLRAGPRIEVMDAALLSYSPPPPGAPLSTPK